MALGGALGPAWAPVTPRHFAWQAWHNLTSTFVSRGRRGTKSHPPSFCVAGVGQMALGGALGPAWAPVTPRHFAWQAWHNLTSTFVSRGRRGTKSHPPSFCVAGVGQMALGGALGPAWAPVTPRHFAWQAWHKLTRSVVLRGRRGTNSHLPSFCVVGVGQMAPVEVIVVLSSFSPRPIVNPMWEEWGCDGQIKTVRDMCCRLNCIVSTHVALIASCIYAFCPFAARYFFALAS